MVQYVERDIDVVVAECNQPQYQVLKMLHVYSRVKPAGPDFSQVLTEIALKNNHTKGH